MIEGGGSFHDNFDDHYFELVVGAAMDESATGIAIVPTITRTVYDNAAPWVGFTALAELGGTSFRCAFRLASTHGVDPNGRIVYCDSVNDGVTWSPPLTLVDTPGLDDRDPTFFVHADGTNHICWFQHSPEARQGFTSAMFGPAMNIPGFPVSPNYAERSTARPVGFDGGERYVLYGGPQSNISPWKIGIIDWVTRIRLWLQNPSWFLYEPTILRISPTRLFIVMRSAPTGSLGTDGPMYYTDSSDNGATWSALRPFSFSADAPNVWYHSSGLIVLVVKFSDGPATRHTAIVWSNDFGRTWSNIANGIVYTHSTTDASYPDVKPRTNETALLVTHYEPRIIRVTDVPLSDPVTNAINDILALGPVKFYLTRYPTKFMRFDAANTQLGDQIDIWRDLSLSGVNATQNTDAEQPTMIDDATGIWLRFDGAVSPGDGLNTAPVLSASTAATTFTAFQRNAAGVVQRLWGYNNFSFAAKWSSGNVFLAHVGGSFNRAEVLDVTLTRHIYEIDYNGLRGPTNADRLKVFFDEVLQVPTFTGTIPAAMPVLTSGEIGRIVNTERLQGKIAMHLEFNRELTPAEKAIVYSRAPTLLPWYP